MTTIRPATPGDTSAVLSLWSRARSAAAVTPDDAASVASVLAHDALIVAEADGVIVGVIIAGWDGWRGNLYRLAVLPSHRRRGVGSALVEAAHARLRALGAVRVTALVGFDEDEARGLWLARGYGFDPEIARFVRNL